MVAAGGPTDPLSPPPHGREAVAPAMPSTPKAEAPSVSMPAKAKLPNVPSVAKPAAVTGASATKAPRPEQSVKAVQAPEEEVVVDANGKMKLRTMKRPTRKAETIERAEPAERKNPWSTDRYAAVVPPGLTLAALRSQLNKTGPTTTPEPSTASEHSGPPQTLSEIEKAREALRQETARLEALLRATGNCGGGGGIGAPVGDSLMPTPVSPAAIREAASEQIDSVSKAMKGMKPEQAAAVVARLDRKLAAEIMRRMKSTDAGAILGLLKPELAAELATEIAIRKPSFPKEKKGSTP
jgi:hypothetical protein